MRKVAKKVCKLSLFSQLSAPIKSGVMRVFLLYALHLFCYTQLFCFYTLFLLYALHLFCYTHSIYFVVVRIAFIFDVTHIAFIFGAHCI